jgi:hypothetical protein
VTVAAGQLGGREARSAGSGRRLGVASLLLLVAPIVLYVPLYFVGTAIMSALDLHEGAMLTEAGLLGVMAAAAMLAAAAAPQLVGVALGVKARRLGERRLGTWGVVTNALLCGFLVLGPAAQLLAA